MKFKLFEFIYWPESVYEHAHHSRARVSGHQAHEGGGGRQRGEGGVGRERVQEVGVDLITGFDE